MRVLVTGAAGQDGSYLTEACVKAGHEVHCLVRDQDNLASLRAVEDRIRLSSVSLLDHTALSALMSEIEPDRCFHFAAQSAAHGADVGATLQINAMGTVHLLDALARHASGCRFLLAGSAEQLAAGPQSPFNERSPEAPRSEYGLSKAMAAQAVRFYRSRRELFAATAILFNHESPRRGPGFISRKLARAAARIAAGLENSVDVGDLDAIRDWGYAPDYVDAMLRMLEKDSPVDVVICTGVGRTVRDMARAAFGAVGLEADPYLRVRQDLQRLPDPVALIGDPSFAATWLGWRPSKAFDEMMADMVEAERTALSGSSLAFPHSGHID